MRRHIEFPSNLFMTGERDEQADREVGQFLAELPPDHLARRAYARGRATMEITHHLRDRRDLAHKLMNACWDHYRRTTPRVVRGRPGHPTRPTV